MFPAAYDLKEYYATPQGCGVSALLLARFGAWWPRETLKGEVLVGAGYALPYLDACVGPQNCFALLPAAMGAVMWPSTGPQRCVVSDHTAWPIPHASLDFVLMVHELEYAQEPGHVLEAAWHALKPEGRLMVVVPNRTGLWARAEKTPFGHGRPFTTTQLHDLLRDQNFALERMTGALLAPPYKNETYMQKVAPVVERLAPFCAPLCGVIVAEATKRLYSPIRGITKPVTKPALNWGGQTAVAGPLRKKHDL